MQKPTLPKICDQKELKGKYVLLRTSFNVPIENSKVANEFRIARAMPTINYLRAQGARTIIVAHIGRETTDTLEPVVKVLEQLIPVTFSKTRRGELLESHRNGMQNGDVLLLENIRQDAREKANDEALATELAALADIYVNDAFAASHRSHTSIVGVPALLPSYFGMNFIHEFEEQWRAMQPEHPALFILGGAKFDTKMPLVEEYIEHYDQVFVGGALANDIFKARGLEVGTSLVSDVDLTGSSLLTNEKLLVPVDVTVKNNAGEVRVCLPTEVASDESILDSGPATIAMLKPYVDAAQIVLWNGPLGDYEHDFEEQTEALGWLIADASGYSILGGGDTVAAIESIGCSEKFDFLSTAGGAMLIFMEQGTLPAIDAVVNK